MVEHDSGEVFGGKFKAAVEKLHAAKNPKIRTLVTQTMNDITSGKVDLKYTSTWQGNFPTISECRVEGLNSPTPQTTIFLDTMKMSFPGEDTIANDLVRTFAIAATYPEGYYGRLVPVYTKALDIQQEWLEDPNNQDNKDVLFDPRMAREQTLMVLLGPTQYYLDLGFDDWQQRLEELKTKAPWYAKRADALNKLDLFLDARETLPGSFFPRLKSHNPEFFSKSPDDRALDISRYYINSIIFTENQRASREN